MPDLETQLRRYGADLDERFPDVALDEIAARARGRARSAVRPVLRLVITIAAVVGIVGVGVLVVGVLVDLDTPAPIIAPVPHDPVDDRTSPGGEPAGVEVAAPGLVLEARNGVLLVPFGTPDEAVLVPSDGYGVAWVMPDRRGGLIFQHNETPDVWPPGAILWLRAGADEPEVLVPPATGWAPSARWGGAYPIAGLWPFGVATSGDGHAMFVYTADTRASRSDNQAVIMAADLDDSGAIRQLATLQEEPGLASDQWLLVGGDTVAVVDQPDPDEDCDVITMLLRVDDGAEVPATADCLPGGAWGLRALSHDGRTLAAIGPRDVFLGTTPPSGPFTVDVIDLETGVTLEQRTLDLGSGESWADLGLLASPDGWLVYHEGHAFTDDFVLVDLDGNVRTRIDKQLVPPGAWGPRRLSWPGYRNTSFYLEHVELAGAASLGPPHDQDRPVEEPDEEPAALGSAPQPDQVSPTTVERAGPPQVETTLLWVLVAALVAAIGVGLRRRSPTGG
jgi:hypothetical protein